MKQYFISVKVKELNTSFEVSVNDQFEFINKVAKHLLFIKGSEPGVVYECEPIVLVNNGYAGYIDKLKSIEIACPTLDDVSYYVCTRTGEIFETFKDALCAFVKSGFKNKFKHIKAQ